MRHTTERGSALVLAVFVTAVVVLLGAGFLMSTTTESHIAWNETVAARAAHGAETGARAVKAWFDRPWGAMGFPTQSVVIRQRQIVDEGDPYGPGTVPGPQYKEGIDGDADGRDDLFQPPYRGAPAQALLGRADAPDMRIVDATFLGQLSQTLVGHERDGLRTRIVSIEVSAPPYIRAGGVWQRQGIGTVQVRAAVERSVGGKTETMAQASVTLVLGEVPYSKSVFGPLHSCADLTLSGPLQAAWGPVTVGGDVHAPAGLTVHQSLPRRPMLDARNAALWTDDPAWIAEFDGKIGVGKEIQDPWLRLVAAGSIEGAPMGVAQPFAGPGVPAPGTPGPWPCCDGSNVFQDQASVTCPDYPYVLWKALARSGEARVHYYRFCGSGFCEDGAGVPRSIQDLLAEAQGRDGLFFFDTLDARAPHDDDGDGSYDNLTPAVVVDGTLAARGFVYLNASSFEALDLAATLPVELTAPGEIGASGLSAWVNLAYPASIDGLLGSAGAGDWTSGGPLIATTASFHGVFFTSGSFRAVGPSVWIGSIVAREGAVLEQSATGSPHIYWDASMARNWPPPTWHLPRTAVVSMAFTP